MWARKKQELCLIDVGSEETRALPDKLPESRLLLDHIPSHIGIKPKMKARAELCQKVNKCLLKDGRMIHRHSMTFWHAPDKLPESRLIVSRL